MDECKPLPNVYQDLEAPARLLELSAGGAGLVQAADEIGDVVRRRRSTLRNPRRKRMKLSA